MLGFNERTIRRDINSMSEDVRQMSVESPTNARYILLTEYGLKWIADKHNIILDNVFSNEKSHTEKFDISENEVIKSLLEQLHQKDIQLSEKDKQIDMLIEQAKNFQVLLQGQQMLSLPEKKRTFFKRLFSRGDDEN